METEHEEFRRNEQKLFAQRIGLIGVTNLITSLSGIILLPILTKTLSIEDYGIWVQISVTIGLIPVIVTLGLPEAMVRFLAGAKKKDEIRESFYTIVVIIMCTSLAASLLLFTFTDVIAAAIFNNNNYIAKIVFVIVFVESLNSILLHYFRAFHQIKRYSIFTFIRTFLVLVLISYFVFSAQGIFGAVIGYLISSIILLVIQAFIIFDEIGIKIPKFLHAKEYLAFGLPIIPSFLSNWVVTSSDRYLIGILLGTASAGYYSPGYVFGSAITMLSTPLIFMLPTILSKYYDRGNEESVKIILKYSLKYFLFFAIPSVFGLSLLSKQLLTIFSTSDIASHGYMITPFVAVSYLLFGSYAVIAQILNLEKRTKISGAIWSMAAILNFGLNLVFIPRIGILGAAITTLIAFAFAFALITYYSFKYITVDIDFNFIVKCIVASSIMSLVIVIHPTSKILGVLTIIGICAVVYTVILLLLGGIKRSEVEFFQELLFL